MSCAHKRILGTVAIGITFGAVQIAWGEGVSGRLVAAKAPATVRATTNAVNRAAKADRGAPVVTSPEATRTLSFRVDRLPATSVVVRVPAREARGGSIPAAPAPNPANGLHKPMTACEPVVSVLTEIARQLQPGRCVT